MTDLPADQLTRTRSRERDTTWPDELAIVATRRKVNEDGTVSMITTRRVIDRDQFFGVGAYQNPVNGDWLVTQIDRMRKSVRDLELSTDDRAAMNEIEQLRGENDALADEVDELNSVLSRR